MKVKSAFISTKVLAQTASKITINMIIKMKENALATRDEILFDILLTEQRVTVVDCMAISDIPQVED